MSATATTTTIDLTGPYVRPVLMGALAGMILHECECIDMQDGPQAPHLDVVVAGDDYAARGFLDYIGRMGQIIAALNTTADESAATLDWPFGHDVLVKNAESAVHGTQEWLSEAPVGKLPVLVEAVAAGEAFLASLGPDEHSEDSDALSVEPRAVASSSGSVPLPLEDIAAIDRVLQGHLLDMGFGENFSLEEFLGIGTRPFPAAFEAMGDRLTVIARVLKALESREYPLDGESRELLAALIQEAEKDAADPLDDQDKILAVARLEWLRLAQGVVSRCADEHARETMTEGGDE